MKTLAYTLSTAVALSGCAARNATPPQAPTQLAGASVDGSVCITLQRGKSGAVEDARIAESWPTKNYGSEDTAFTGAVGAKSRRMLLKFDVSSVPPGARITKAVVTLRRTTCGSDPVFVQRATAAWSEHDVTWSSFADAVERENLGAINASTEDEVVSFDATALVRDWVDGAAPNYGLSLSQVTSNSGFETSEASDRDARPRLDVCFVGGAP